MNVPGEDEYRNRGVAYCPHCDGPLYKGKRVAVIGGGNSGVEAAIDLAGIVAHVTLIEFDTTCAPTPCCSEEAGQPAQCADDHLGADHRVQGDGARVTGLRYKDRNSGAAHEVALEGVFVQIGLVPNTEWLKDAVALTARGEIEVDFRGQTSSPACSRPATPPPRPTSRSSSPWARASRRRSRPSTS